MNLKFSFLLGGEDLGADTLDNILCLCPNHHVLFDLGAFVITEDFRIEWLTIPEEFKILNVHPNHKIEQSNLWYHREKWTF
jgi:putative restriction endonuclease